MNTRGGRAVFGVLATGVLLASARPATAYVPSVTRLGCHPLHWGQSCVYFTSSADSLPELPLVDIERIVQQSLVSWAMPLQGKSYVRLRYLPASGVRETASDGLQLVKFRSDTWCRPPEESDGQAICYDPAATAVTTVSYVSNADDPAGDGRIIDADIELNAVDNYFYEADVAVTPVSGDRTPVDLWNTLSHEIGHTLGLDETCVLGAGGLSCERDGDGQPVILCSAVENGRATDARLEAIYDTTMYALAKPGEIKKRNPKADDIAGAVASAPRSEDPILCVDPSGDAGASVAPVEAGPPASARSGGCAVGGGGAPGGLCVVGFLAFWVWRQRRG